MVAFALLPTSGTLYFSTFTEQNVFTCSPLIVRDLIHTRSGVQVLLPMFPFCELSLKLCYACLPQLLSYGSRYPLLGPCGSSATLLPIAQCLLVLATLAHVCGDRCW